MNLDLKDAHVFSAALSLGPFAFRGVLMLWTRHKPSARLVRLAPLLVDSLLLACGIGLLLIMCLDPLTTPWLAVKLLCVVAYILLGMSVFRIRRPHYLRVALFAAAIALFGFIASIALTMIRGVYSAYSAEEEIMAERYRRFRDFYPFYLGEHSNRACRRMHFIGSTLVLVTLAGVLVTGRLWGLLLMPLFGYGFAWMGHFFFEKNRPATFTYPLYSFMGDWVMYRDILTGRIGI